MIYNLPFTIEVDGVEYAIRKKCDYRIVLGVIDILTSAELSENEKIRFAIELFFEKPYEITDISKAMSEMFKIIDMDDKQLDRNKDFGITKPVMDWKHDFMLIAPPVSRILGYSVRNPDNYTHWYDFVGAYMEIGKCLFNDIVAIRQKIQRGKQLDKNEKEFFVNHKEQIMLPDVTADKNKEWLWTEEGSE